MYEYQTVYLYLYLRQGFWCAAPVSQLRQAKARGWHLSTRTLQHLYGYLQCAQVGQSNMKV